MRSFIHFILSAITVLLAQPVTASPHFGNFMKGEASIGQITLYDVNISGGTPGTCVPGLTFTNLTTGRIAEIRQCCDDYFWDPGDGTWNTWELGYGDNGYFVSNDGDLDEIVLLCPWNVAPLSRQVGIWRGTAEPGVFERFPLVSPLATPQAPTTWGAIKSTYR